MIDFHSHILPDMDDGATSVEMSLQMLKDAYMDGIETVVSTSHAYLESDEDVDDFLERRQLAYETLCDAMKQDGGKFPEIKLGAEVRVLKNISELKRLKELAIEGTDYILLEMPYDEWTEDVVEEVYNVKITGLVPIMAHIERFLRYRDEFFGGLKFMGALFQVNADAFTHSLDRTVLLNMFYRKQIDILGSDMHNLDGRKNNMKECRRIIQKRFGQEFWSLLEANSKDVIAGKETGPYPQLPKLGFFAKLRL